MFCSECGAAAEGKFCSSCGTPLKRNLWRTATTAQAPSVQAPIQSGADWRHDPRFDVVVGVASIRAAIAQRMQQAKPGLSAEKFLAIADKVIPGEISYAGLAEVVMPMYASWGIRTGKEQAELILAPIGTTLARALCSFASQGQAMTAVEQAETSCVLTVELPSSIYSFQGEMKLALTSDGQSTEATATTNQPGQLIDWGKSTRCLEQLFKDLHTPLELEFIQAEAA